MTKIVYNNCYGGFSISSEAAELYQKLGGTVEVDRWGSRDIPRDDPVLVQVVQALGDAANGSHADLAIIDLPKGTVYRISEYDGYEDVKTFDEHSWKIA